MSTAGLAKWLHFEKPPPRANEAIGKVECLCSCMVCLVCLVSLVERDEPDQRNEPEQLGKAQTRWAAGGLRCLFTLELFRILMITGGSSMAAMIFKVPPQFGQCSMPMSDSLDATCFYSQRRQGSQRRAEARLSAHSRNDERIRDHASADSTLRPCCP